jgi:hypothetical protein
MVTTRHGDGAGVVTFLIAGMIGISPAIADRNSGP